MLHLATIDDAGAETPVLVDHDRGVVALSSLTGSPPDDVMAVIDGGHYDDLVAAAAASPDEVWA